MKTTSLLLALLLYLVLPSMIRCEQVGRDHSDAAEIRVGGEVRVSSDHGDWNFGEAFAAADRTDAGSQLVCTTAREPRVAAARSSVFYVSLTKT